jgi:hypothetical protein
VPLRYPCIIYSSFEHHAPNCPWEAKNLKHVSN